MKKIKTLTIKDLPSVREFIFRQKDEFEHFIDLGWNIESIENHFKKTSSLSIGHFNKDRLRTILIGDKIINDENFDLEIHILFVEKIIRRNDIGTSLLQYLENNKHLLNISKIYIEVSEKNIIAIKFYEKNNFVFFKFRHNYYIENNIKINAKCYYKKI